MNTTPLQPAIGTTLPLTTREDAFRFDFNAGVRAFLRDELEPVLVDKTNEAFDAFERAHGHPVGNIPESRDAVEKLPIMAAYRRFTRTVQEELWSTLIDSYDKRRDSILAELDKADKAGPGSVEYDPDFDYPNYFRLNFHLQPGGFYQHPLIGAVYHYGSSVIVPDNLDADSARDRIVSQIRTPADGSVKRVLDIACSSGLSATALKARFPDAEIWGADAGAPMVRYAHMRAMKLGLDVHFAQRLAEDTKFPDDHFDIVYCFILLHEVPRHVAEKIVREVYRILRPGGVFVNIDVPNMASRATPLRHFRNYNVTHFNAEPYWAAWTMWDFAGHLREIFASVEEGQSGLYNLEGNDDMTVAIK